mgnify:CR=1 FL=1
MAEKIAPTDGKLAIAEKYINKTISIVRKASDANHVDSTVQTITLGSRAAQPTGLTGIKPTAENGNGKITGTTADMQYKEKDNNEDTWHDCTVTETEVTAGKTYIVRIKAIVDGEDLQAYVPKWRLESMLLRNLQKQRKIPRKSALTT